MLSLTIGQPRSGKSYRLVSFIYDEFQKFKQNNSKYKNIYTNINGFKFDKFDGFVKRFNKSDLEIVMQAEYDLYLKNEKGSLEHDGDYDKYAIEHEVVAPFNNCLLVIDEAYGTFSTEFEKYKNRFLSYHGHFGIDIEILLQSKDQTNRKYLGHVEVLWQAQPSGKRFLSKIFRYKRYSTAKVLKNNYIDSVSLKFNPVIGALYNTGSTEKYKSFVGKKLFPLFLGIIVVGVYLFYFSSPKIAKEENAPIPTNDNNITVIRDGKPVKKAISSFDSNSFYFRAVCYPDSCRIDKYNLSFNEKNMLLLLNRFECKILIHQIFDENFVHYYISCNEKAREFFTAFKKEVDYENKNFDNSTSVK